MVRQRALTPLQRETALRIESNLCLDQPPGHFHRYSTCLHSTLFVGCSSLILDCPSTAALSTVHPPRERVALGEAAGLTVRGAHESEGRLARWAGLHFVTQLQSFSDSIIHLCPSVAVLRVERERLELRLKEALRQVGPNASPSGWTRKQLWIGSGWRSNLPLPPALTSSQLQPHHTKTHNPQMGLPQPVEISPENKEMVIREVVNGVTTFSLPFGRGPIPFGGRSTAVKLSDGSVFMVASHPLDQVTVDKLASIGPIKMIIAPDAE